MDDLQSFTPLRFAVPDTMGHRGVALVVDPDVFAAGDVGELFARDREGKAIWCRARPGHNGAPDYLASSVMLLDCAKLPHWRFAERLEDLFAGRLDYVDWIELKTEPRETVGLLEPEWNDFDRLDPRDAAAPHHQAPHPAVEDRPAGGLHPARARPSGRSRPRWSGRCCASGRRGTATNRTRIRTRRRSSSPCWPSASTRAR